MSEEKAGQGGDEAKDSNQTKEAEKEKDQTSNQEQQQQGFLHMYI